MLLTVHCEWKFLLIFFVSVLATNPAEWNTFFNLSALLKLFLLLWNDKYFCLNSGLLRDEHSTYPTELDHLKLETESHIGEHFMCTFIHPFSNRRRDWRKSTFSPHTFEHGEAARRNFDGKCGDLGSLGEECCVCEEILFTNFSQCEESNSTLSINFVQIQHSSIFTEKRSLSLDDPEKASNICPFTCLLDILRYYVLLSLWKEIRNLQIFHQFEIPRPHLALNSKFFHVPCGGWDLLHILNLTSCFASIFSFSSSLSPISHSHSTYTYIVVEWNIKKTLRKSCSDYAMYYMFVVFDSKLSVFKFWLFEFSFFRTALPHGMYPLISSSKKRVCADQQQQHTSSTVQTSRVSQREIDFPPDAISIDCCRV